MSTPQPYRGRLTPPKWRALRSLACGPRLVACRPQTIRALLRFALIREAGQGRYALTPAGQTALVRYRPRRRASARRATGERE